MIDIVPVVRPRVFLVEQPRRWIRWYANESSSTELDLDQNSGKVTPFAPSSRIDACAPQAARSRPHERALRLKGNFNFAARAVGLKCQIDGTAEFMRNEIADEVQAIAAGNALERRDVDRCARSNGY
jgi:hypothetical protein